MAWDRSCLCNHSWRGQGRYHGQRADRDRTIGEGLRQPLLAGGGDRGRRMVRWPLQSNAGRFTTPLSQPRLSIPAAVSRESYSTPFGAYGLTDYLSLRDHPTVIVAAIRGATHHTTGPICGLTVCPPRGLPTPGGALYIVLPLPACRKGHFQHPPPSPLSLTRT